MKADSLKIVYSESDIEQRVKDIANEINSFYEGKPLVLICVLKGAFMFFSDLLKHINVRPEIDFVRVASYGKGQTSGTISFTKDIELNIFDKHVILVEDIVDSGNTIDFLVKQMEARGAASLKVAALISKSERREKSIPVDFCGFYLSSSGFLVGYGLDYADKYRELSAVYEVVS